MNLPVQSFASLVGQMAAALQGGAAQLLDLTVGSVLRALIEAAASVALWLQWMILQVLSATRAATSAGPDLDSWMADFSLTRLAGTPAKGVATFGRYSLGFVATIPVASTIATFDGSQQFLVVAQPSNPAWNGINGYTIGANVSSIDLPVQAASIGVSGNILAGAVGIMTSPIPGVDTVSNAQNFDGGTDGESDAAFRQRFVLYINSRSLATTQAISFAIASIQSGLRYSVLENQTVDGTLLTGYFCAIVDDGTGSPPASLLAAAQQAIDQARPIGSIYGVFPPLAVPVAVSMTLETSGGSTHAAIAQNVQAAISTWIRQLPIGGTLALSKLDALAHDTDPGVISVVGAAINGAAQDVTAPSSGVLVASSVSVS